MDIWIEFVKSWWILFPAYAANLFPVLSKGTHPIDFGRNFFDGNRILGDGKTFEGFGLGFFIGFLVGSLESYLYPSLNLYANQFGASLPYMNLLVGAMIAFGALTGDLCGSFIKRRVGLKRGADALLLDQLNFVIGAIAFAYWFTEITIWMILIIILITPIVHRLACIIGYHLKIKKEPW